MCAFSGPPYCCVHARAASSGSASAASLSISARSHGCAPPQRSSIRFAPAPAPVTSTVSRVVSAGALAAGCSSSAPHAVSAVAASRAGSEQGEASHGPTTRARPIRHTPASR